MRAPLLFLVAAGVAGAAVRAPAGTFPELEWRGLALASPATTIDPRDPGLRFAGSVNPIRPVTVHSPAVSLLPDREETALAPQRTPLSWMTAGVVIVQFATVFAFRNNPDWVEEGHRYWDGFTQWPVWDDDSWVYNYVAHPWVGSEYYLIARNRGWTPWGSLAYSAACSTFFEFFVENLLQPPSATDLIVTPLAGALVGEARYALRERIRRKPERVRGARLWIALLDPIDLSIGGFPDGRLRLYLNWKHAF